MAGEEAVGHGGDALDAAEVEDVVGATEVHRIEDAGMDPAMLRRRHRAGDDVADASHLGGGDRHDGRSDMGVAPARHIAAGGLHGNEALTGEEAGRQLGLELPHRVALALGEVANAGKGEVDILLQARSEENTSELQSLMRISYAVFCLKNNNLSRKRV